RLSWLALIFLYGVGAEIFCGNDLRDFVLSRHEIQRVLDAGKTEAYIVAVLVFDINDVHFPAQLDPRRILRHAFPPFIPRLVQTASYWPPPPTMGFPAVQTCSQGDFFRISSAISRIREVGNAMTGGQPSGSSENQNLT